MSDILAGFQHSLEIIQAYRHLFPLCSYFPVFAGVLLQKIHHTLLDYFLHSYVISYVS